MAEDTGKTKSRKKKLGSQILRERIGGVPKAVLQASRSQAAIHKSIRGALKGGPKTVPELAQETGIPSREVFWNLVALTKYGEIERQQERDGYYAYALPKGGGEKK